MRASSSQKNPSFSPDFDLFFHSGSHTTTTNHVQVLSCNKHNSAGLYCQSRDLPALETLQQLPLDQRRMLGIQGHPSWPPPPPQLPMPSVTNRHKLCALATPDSAPLLTALSRMHSGPSLCLTFKTAQTEGVPPVTEQTHYSGDVATLCWKSWLGDQLSLSPKAQILLPTKCSKTFRRPSFGSHQPVREPRLSAYQSEKMRTAVS